MRLRTRREKESLISGGPDRPKCDILFVVFLTSLSCKVKVKVKVERREGKEGVLRMRLRKSESS